MTQAIVRVHSVCKHFTRGSERIDVLDHLSLEMADGEFLALMGPSGSGKTTLLNLIAGLDQPSEGDIFVGNELISHMSESELAHWRTRHIGFIFQFYHLLPVLTAYENVELPLLLLPLSAAERKQQVSTALELVGLSDRLHHRPGQLSGGQQQRVGIARAIVTDPTLIVADEPTGDLDAKSAHEILDLLGELRQSLQKTILMVTHDPRAAVRAGRILHLDKGQLVKEAAPGLETAIRAAAPQSGVIPASDASEESFVATSPVCPHCGQYVLARAVKCPGCGGRLRYKTAIEAFGSFGGMGLIDLIPGVRDFPTPVRFLLGVICIVILVSVVVWFTTPPIVRWMLR
jgi:putative ABC transport system ATP-binding protein